MPAADPSPQNKLPGSSIDNDLVYERAKASSITVSEVGTPASSSFTWAPQRANRSEGADQPKGWGGGGTTPSGVLQGSNPALQAHPSPAPPNASWKVKSGPQQPGPSGVRECQARAQRGHWTLTAAGAEAGAEPGPPWPGCGWPVRGEGGGRRRQLSHSGTDRAVVIPGLLARFLLLRIPDPSPPAGRRPESRPSSEHVTATERPRGRRRWTRGGAVGPGGGAGRRAESSSGGAGSRPGRALRGRGAAGPRVPLARGP